MQICHAIWQVPKGNKYSNLGRFHFWVETSVSYESNGSRHPNSLLTTSAIIEFLNTNLRIPKSVLLIERQAASELTVTLPSDKGYPLPSYEMAQMMGTYLQDDFTWNRWKIATLEIKRPLVFLRELQFIFAQGVGGVILGHDLRFWVRYAAELSRLVKQHQFLPVMKAQPSGKKKKPFNISVGWSPAARLYEESLRNFAAAMPTICTTLNQVQPISKAKKWQPKFCDQIGVLRHFSEQQLEQLITNTTFTKSFLNSLRGSWLLNALDHQTQGQNMLDLTDDDFLQWSSWYHKIIGRSADVGFDLGLRIGETKTAKKNQRNGWQIHFFVAAKRDPSLRIDLAEWWKLSETKKARWKKEFGGQFEHDLLIGLGHASRICPLLWSGMVSSQPTGLDIDLDAAYGFLKDDALVLESAGFKIVLPSWWTPKGRRRAQVRIKVSHCKTAGADSQHNGGFLSMENLVNYHYDLAIDGEPVTEQEWMALIEAKTPLVKVRGEWMEIHTDQLKSMLEMWREQDSIEEGFKINQLLKDLAEADEDTISFELDEALEDTLQGLQSQEKIQEAENPTHLKGQLRNYQKNGLAWLLMQESLGLNPCLADDMGLGKTIQLIALLLKERQDARSGCPPTLLIAPTSVLSNWQREVEKFAPSLKCLIHHGPDRLQEREKFESVIDDADLVVTSFALARSDKEMFKKIHWHRVMVDEAQNIKNPRSAQAKAVFSFPATHRIAVTGTPIENRLLDLWSLFHFLNPGYLGSLSQFKKAYETPIQRQSNARLSRQLQQLVRPFILRRLKTDKSIIQDLPDKVEQKVYCNLTKEQASLYEAVVKDVEEQIQESEGIQRRGLMLSTLMKLKQICNHPAQFLQDGSIFAESRSHKLTRMNEMVEEALNESDSMLIFSQFTEVGGQLEALLRKRHECPVYYLHGGTNRKRRDKMIESFQSPESPPSIFVLSLKAGGVGITLTQANHVFHFDRWWNPAVENQATDRAYRIGQEKTVFAHKMVVLGTLEERIDDMIETKQALADNIVGVDEDWLTEMDNDSFRELIALNRQQILEN